MSRPWVLPGPQAPYFVFLSKEKVDRSAYRQVPSARAVEMLKTHWLDCCLTSLQEMEEALAGGSSQARSVHHLRQSLTGAFLSHRLLVFESTHPISSQDYDVYACVVMHVSPELSGQELQIQLAMSIGKRSREDITDLVNKGEIPSLAEAQVSKDGTVLVVLFGYEYSRLTGLPLRPTEPTQNHEPAHPRSPVMEQRMDWQSQDGAGSVKSADPQAPRGDIRDLSHWSRIFKALSLSIDSWPGETREAAKRAFSDPLFITSLIAVTSFYVFLWLSPDPTGATKLFASGLTIYLWAQFGWDDLYGTFKEFRKLMEACDKAGSEEDLKTAGDVFAKKVGQVGFDILLMLVMWKAGKAAQPELAKIGMNRALASAEARVAAAEYQPGTNKIRPAQGDALNLLRDAKASAGSAEPSQILDALAKRLSPEGQRGLSQYRKTMNGDAQALNALESRSRQGADLESFLSHKGVEPIQAAKAKADYLQAQQRLSRLQLIKQKTMRDLTLRKAVNDEIARQELKRLLGADLDKSIDKEMARLEQERLQDPERSKPNREKLMRKKLQSLLDPHSRTTLREKAAGLLMKMLRSANVPPEAWEKINQGIQLGDPETLVGELGEAIQRSILGEEYPRSAGYNIFSNIEVVRLVEGFSRIADWQAAERASGGTGDARGFYEADNKVWKSITEIDALVAIQDAGGQWRPVEMEQVKTGTGDQPARAAAQNAKAQSGLNEIAGGNRSIRLYERVSKNTLGMDITNQFNLKAIDNINFTTRGLPGKGFSGDVLFPRELLVEVARYMIEKKGLPPVSMPRPVPITRSHRQVEHTP